MYVLTKDGTTLGYTDDVVYVKKYAENSYVVCDEAEATGVSYHGVAYHLSGRDHAEDYEIGGVAVSEIDIGDVVFIAASELEILLGGNL